MIRSKGWLVWGLLLSCLFLAACAGPMAQDESLPGAGSTSVDVAASEPTASATVPNTPTVTPNPSPTVTLEPTPEPSLTPRPTPTPAPTATTAITVGMQNEAGQWWDGDGWQEVQEFQNFVFNGTEFQAARADGLPIPLRVPEKFIGELQRGEITLNQIQQTKPGNEFISSIFTSDGREWRIANFQDIEGNSYSAVLEISYLDEPLRNPNIESLKADLNDLEITLNEYDKYIQFDLDNQPVNLKNILIGSIQMGSVVGIINGNEVEYPTVRLGFIFRSNGDYTGFIAEGSSVLFDTSSDGAAVRLDAQFVERMFSEPGPFSVRLDNTYGETSEHLRYLDYYSDFFKRQSQNGDYRSLLISRPISSVVPLNPEVEIETQLYSGNAIFDEWVQIWSRNGYRGK